MIRIPQLFLSLAVTAGSALARQTSNSGLGINMGKGDALSVPMQIVILLTLLTLLPAIIMSITPFLRITIVLHFLRQALGTQTVPSNQVLVGIAMFLDDADHATGGGADVSLRLGAAAKRATDHRVSV